MERHLLGVFTIVLAVAGFAAQQLTPPDTTLHVLGGPAWRIAILSGVLWLAIPNLLAVASKTPAWLSLATAVGLLLIAVRPRSALMIVPVLILLWVLSVQWFSSKRGR